MPGVRRGSGLLAGVAASALLAGWAFAQDGQSIDGCQIVDGRLPDGCSHANAGTVVAMPAGENTEMEEALGVPSGVGYSITIDALEPGQAPVLLEGDPQRVNEYRRVDRVLDEAGVQVRLDGLGVDPRLAVSTDDMRRSYRAGEAVRFRAASNYPAYIRAAEVRILDSRDPSRVIEVLPVRPNGTVDWSMPAGGEPDMVYTLRAYDAAGRYDETLRLPISRTTAALPDPVLDGPVIAPGEGDNMLRRQTIPVRGGAVTVFADNLTPNSTVNVMGEAVPVDGGGAFVVQRILPPGYHDVRVGVGQRTIRRTVDVPKDDWFYIGAVDVTIGRENDETYKIGRVAGYAKGFFANGVAVTAAIDTRENDLSKIFRDFGAKEPYDALRRIGENDVYPTFGDDSVAIEDAPTSGKFYLKAQKDNSFALWGDFKTTDEGLPLVRSDRTLYGLQLHHESRNLTQHGEPRLKFTGYAAQPDRLVQRDVLRGTGGTMYALSRQDILTGTATLLIQWRDPVSGIVVRQQRLVEGEDYEINHFQGLVILNDPLDQSGGGGFVTDRPLGRYDIELVAQYEYVPTVGNVDGISAGARVEGWVNDNLRLGASAQKETTGVADNTLYGVDALWRMSERTWLELNFARSEGPGFGASNSFNGGIDFDPSKPSSGAIGNPATAVHVEGRADLAELSGGRMQGEVGAYYDKKEAGFVSADYDIETTQRAWGTYGRIDVSERAELTFGYDNLEDDAGKKRTDARVGVGYKINELWLAEVEALHTDRNDPAGALTNNGKRTDVGVRVTYSPSEDLSAWIFAQTTVTRSGGLPKNNRVGVGAEARVTDKLSVTGEISDGSLGTAGYAGVTYQPNAGSEFHVGYRLDPMRRYEETGFTGKDDGVWVVGARQRISSAVTYTAESTYDLAGDNPSLGSRFGVTYTPSDVWTYELGVIQGWSEDPVSGDFKRRGFSFGVDYRQGEAVQAGLKGEYRRETSTDSTRDRETYGVRSYLRYQVSDDWRLLMNLDALVSESDQSSVRDGRYVEANIGFAYRPVANDRFNALFRYTYLYDLPGPDQVNYDGDLDGPRQKTHILSADVAYDLTKEFTLGGKLGYRKSEVQDRTGGAFNDNSATLGIVRLDYHVVHNWDIVAEARVMRFHESSTTERGAVLGAWRHFGNNVKVGVGYQWGDISDDLRDADGKKEGPFLNIIAKF